MSESKIGEIVSSLFSGVYGISKSETMETIISSIRRVASGKFVLSPEAESARAGEKLP